MEYAFVIEPAFYTAFEDDEDQLEQCKSWGLLSEKALKTKAYMYKGYGMSLTCTIVGYTDKTTAVVAFDNAQLHCIHPSYLKEMQAANFSLRQSAGADEATDTVGGSDIAGKDEAPASGIGSGSAVAKLAAEPENLSADDKAAASPLAESAADTGPSDAVADGEAELAPPAQQPAQPAASASASVSAPAADKTAAKGKTKKPAKLVLPEEKVKMTATVQMFTKVPNHFTDAEDEVVVYDAVAIVDPPIEVGAAWSSYSATLKKLELQEGDTIAFEAKIVPKKLTKHPVPYKINNPAKIQKTGP